MYRRMGTLYNRLSLTNENFNHCDLFRVLENVFFFHLLFVINKKILVNMSLVWNPVRAMYQYADVCEWISHVMQKARSFSNIFFVEKEMVCGRSFNACFSYFSYLRCQYDINSQFPVDLSAEHSFHFLM